MGLECRSLAIAAQDAVGKHPEPAPCNPLRQEGRSRQRELCPLEHSGG